MRFPMRCRWLALASLFFASAALAGSTTGSASGSAKTGAAVTSAAHQASGSAAAHAAAKADLSASLAAEREALEKKAARISAKARAGAESQLEASAAKVDECAARQGEAAVAARLAGELGVNAEALMAEQDRLGCGWGDLMIAHALGSNAKTELETAELVKLHDAGCRWADVTAGLGLDLSSATRGLGSEARVAAGLARGDGRLSVMTGTGARAGLGVGTGVGVGGTSAGVKAGVGVGVGVKVGRK